MAFGNSILGLGAVGVEPPNMQVGYVRYIGDGNATQSITTGIGFQPDFTWIKADNGTDSHIIQDINTVNSSYISTSSVNGSTSSTTNVISYDPEGFTVGSNINQSGVAYQAMAIRASNVFETVTAPTRYGTTTKTTQVTACEGFSVVRYTGDSNFNVPHGMGVTPNMILLKNLSRNVGWVMFINDNGTMYKIDMNETSAATTAASALYAWDDEMFSLIRNYDQRWQQSGDEYVAYCFAENPNACAVRYYTAASGNYGNVFNAGFSQQFTMFRRIDAGDKYAMFHRTRQNAGYYLEAQGNGIYNGGQSTASYFYGTSFSLSSGYNVGIYSAIGGRYFQISLGKPV